MKRVCGLMLVGAGLLASVPAMGQAGAAGAVAKPKTAPKQAAPLTMRSLDPTSQADPFPKADPAKFTADAPSVATVEGYLGNVLGWDANRIWRVESIETTVVPGISKVIALVAQRGDTAAKAQSVVFYVLPDGKHLIADQAGPQPFGVHPYAENRTLLEARANGPAVGAEAKDLEFVEFSDLQCVRCKEAQPTMEKLATDFPKAHIVYQSLPLTEIHPYAYEAAAWGACIAADNTKSYLTYAQAVYDKQTDLTPDKVEETLGAAVTKAGLSPEKVSACSKTAVATNSIAASTKLAKDLGIEQTPTLMVNGRQLPLVGVPYETLKAIIAHQAQLDGIAGIGAPSLLAVPGRQ